MGLVRMHHQNAIHFVTNRCFQERLFLLPSRKVNQIIGYWLSRAHNLYGQGLDIFAFIFLSNHFHILLRDTSGNLSRFLGYFQGNVARAINEHLGRKGDFWAREYDDVLVDETSNDDFLNRYMYIICNSVKSGLTDTATEWIGLSSLHAAQKGELLSFTGVNRTRKHLLTRRNSNIDPSKYTETFDLKLAPPPMLAELSQQDRLRAILELARNGEAEFKKQRCYLPALGIKAIRKQKWFDRPRDSSFRPRIKVFASDPLRRKEMLEGYRNFVGIYRQYYDVFINAIKRGKRPVIMWPEWSFPPSTNIPVYPHALVSVG